MSDSFSKVVDLFTETKGDVKYDGNKENLLATIMKNKASVESRIQVAVDCADKLQNQLAQKQELNKSKKLKI